MPQIEHDKPRFISNGGRYGYRRRLPWFDLSCPETKIDPRPQSVGIALDSFGALLPKIEHEELRSISNVLPTAYGKS